MKSDRCPCSGLSDELDSDGRLKPNGGKKMKSLTKSTKDQKIIILNGDNEEDIFKKWLDVIGMLEEDFLKFSETDGFEIRKKLLETDHNF